MDAERALKIQEAMLGAFLDCMVIMTAKKKEASYECDMFVQMQDGMIY